MRRIFIAMLCALLWPLAARADVVRLKIGRDLFGQGWMFLDTDGVCKIVTAAHVIRGLDGKIRPSLALDAHGHEWPTGAPLLVSTDPDIAIVPVPSASTPAGCGNGRLSAIGVERRVAALSGGEIITTGQSEVIQVPVVRRASAMDAGGGQLFTVRPTIESDRVMKGWSGSVVRDDEGPLGIVFEVDPNTNEAYAVRLDAVRAMLAAAGATAPVSAARLGSPPLVAVLSGSTIDPSNGPEAALAGSGSAWRVLPSRHVVVFTATFPAPTHLATVTLQSAPDTSNQITAIDVATQADVDEEDWTDANYCVAQASAAGLSCRFLSRTVARIRIVVRTRNDDPLSLAGFGAQ